MRRLHTISALGLITLLMACGQQAPRPTNTNVNVAPLSGGVSGAAFTTTNPNQERVVDGEELCLNGPGVVNCNIYTRKDYVWINGGPTRPGPSALTAGTYFFAVLEPGGQADPNDGSDSNLSDTIKDDRDTSGGGDSYTNRVFTVDGSGDITSYSGPHAKVMTSDHGLIVQAKPFDDTRNPGGVYIMAMCKIDPATYDPIRKPVDPRKCKYDAFKVKKAEEDKTKVSWFVSGNKYLDANRNGAYDTDENGIGDWPIQVVVNDTAVTPDIHTLPDGSFVINGEAKAPTSGTTTITVQEGTVPGWKQTGNKAYAGVPTNATVTVSPQTGTPITKYTVEIPNGMDASATALDFGNVPLYGLQGEKRYGTTDGATIPGWKVTLYNSDGTTRATDADGNTVPVQFTGPDGKYSFSDLFSGTYIVKESLPQATANAKWSAVGSVTRTVNVALTSAPDTLTVDNFVNVCQVNPGGRTLGFWSNKNGQSVAGTLTNPTALASLTALNLRNKDSMNYDPASLSRFATWLLNADAVNMAYMLSAQLSATHLSSRAGFTDKSVVVEGKTIEAWMKAADDSLLAHGLTVASGQARDEQTVIKNILDSVNNSTNNNTYYNQPDGTRCGYPAQNTVWVD